MISKFNHRKLTLSMSSTNVGMNRHCLVSLILMLEQNMLTSLLGSHPKSQFPVDFS